MRSQFALPEPLLDELRGHFDNFVLHFNGLLDAIGIKERWSL